MTATSLCLETAPRRTLADIRQELAIRRLELLVEHRIAADTADRCRRELAAIERRLEMIDAERLG